MCAVVSAKGFPGCVSVIWWGVLRWSISRWICGQCWHIDWYGFFLRLTPFIADDGLLRVQGRLQFSSLLYDEKHPVLIPKCHLAVLLVRFQHLLMKHAGVGTMISALRSSYWVFGLRRMAKRVKKMCVPCQRQDAVACAQPMAPLPGDRVSPPVPFAVTGLDHAGPLHCCAPRVGWWSLNLWHGSCPSALGCPQKSAKEDLLWQCQRVCDGPWEDPPSFWPSYARMGIHCSQVPLVGRVVGKAVQIRQSCSKENGGGQLLGAGWIGDNSSWNRSLHQ